MSESDTISFQESKKQAEIVRLKDELAVNRSLFENAIGGIYRSTPDGHYLDVNPALARMYGYEKPEDLMSQVSDISHQIYVKSEYRDIFKKEIQQFGVVRGLEYQVNRRDGSTIWISESARVVFDKKGAVRYYEGFIEDITARKEAEQKLHESQQKLLDTSRQIGMAEVATSVLHNMGNALNSINVSIAVAKEKIGRSKVSNIDKVAKLLLSHSSDIGEYMDKDPKGRILPDYIQKLALHLLKEQADVLNELETLKRCVEHVNEIVSMQQKYAKASNLTETVRISDLIDDALRMTSNSLARDAIEVTLNYQNNLPEITVPKHKVLQILLNLIRNAQKACESVAVNKRVVIRVCSIQNEKGIRLEVNDNGAGIPSSNLTRIFSYGFTTRKDGHGFGLHSGALMAKEMGGTLTAHSDGPGRGASFVLEIPCHYEESKGRKKAGTLK